MNAARKKMLDRIRAMMNGEGRTEAEMMAFLAKARELMATYEIDEAELNAAEQENVNFHKAAAQDPYQIKWQLSKFVGKFTRCACWAGNDRIINFAGLESDIIFATWLLDTLQRFVMRALRKHQGELISKGAYHSNNLTSASFVAGCTARICEKLKELTPVEATVNALVLAEMAKNGIVLRARRASQKDIHAASYGAGSDAGANARFDRPVNQSSQRYLK